MLGLLPSSEVAWTTAVEALGPRGGWLHVHGNVAEKDVHEEGGRVIARLVQLAQASKRGEWGVPHMGVTRVKWYAPRVRHVVYDVLLRRVALDEVDGHGDRVRVW